MTRSRMERAPTGFDETPQAQANIQKWRDHAARCMASAEIAAGLAAVRMSGKRLEVMSFHCPGYASVNIKGEMSPDVTVKDIEGCFDIGFGGKLVMAGPNSRFEYTMYTD